MPAQPTGAAFLYIHRTVLHPRKLAHIHLFTSNSHSHHHEANHNCTHAFTHFTTGIDVPVVCAPMAKVTNATLATHVSLGGGFGFVAAG
ncbi:hypothetical protein NM688_g8886 [Phlebia brevispora]|uniref:Uncharacterized protein n=1 Tax=Phlebia brevispora TaxID=194682 RepID=A0ACC1RLU9_9APHY|nr:hypothetical protein NM688_g8886 [Phlebia brevispora]